MQIHLFLFAALCGLGFALPQALGGILGGLVDGLSGLGGLTGYIGPLLSQIPVLAADPPAALKTKNPSPQCSQVNGGALLCCNSVINGDMPLVVELAHVAGNFSLNPNSINGLYCKSPTYSLCYGQAPELTSACRSAFLHYLQPWCQIVLRS